MGVACCFEQIALPVPIRSGNINRECDRALLITNHPMAHSSEKLELENTEDRSTVHLVVLIHGIRDFGEWEESVKGILKTIPGIEVMPLGYEYFDPVRFLVPALFQKGPQRTIAINIRQEKINLKNRGYDQVEVSVIAHSFGTHVILGILDDDSNVDLELNNLILCGAVLPRLYNFRKIQPMVKNRILNFVGCRDIWPITAKIGTFGYGTAGTFGFQAAGPENLYFDFGHGGYFSEKFIKNNWLEVFKAKDAPYSLSSGFRRRHPALVRWLGKLFNGAIPILLAMILLTLLGVPQFSIQKGKEVLGRLESGEESFVEMLDQKCTGAGLSQREQAACDAYKNLR